MDAPDFDALADTPQPRRTLGERLKAERVARGIELADIAARTRIPARQLIAIEANAYDALPNVTFAAGFVKSFARELGVNAEEAAAQFRAETTKHPYVSALQQHETIENDRVPSRRLALVSAAVVVVAIVGAVLWTQRGETPEPQPPAASAPASTPVFGEAAPIPPPLPVAGPAAGPVVLTSAEDAWIEISDRATGVPVMSGILAAGQSYTVPPGDLALRTGRAGALTVTVGGRALPPLGGPVDRIRDVRLDAASLVARAAATPRAAP